MSSLSMLRTKIHRPHLYGVVMIFVLSMVLLASVFYKTSSPTAGSTFTWVGSPNDPRVRAVESMQGRHLTLSNSTVLANDLMGYTDLPQATLIVAEPTSTKDSSYSYTQNNQCTVLIQKDRNGLGALARSILRLGQLQPSKNTGLIQRLNAFEALHELGHCEHAKTSYAFKHTQLTTEENTLLSRALNHGPKSALTSMHREMYADAYAFQHYMNHYIALGLSKQALSDAKLIRQWRMTSTQYSLRQYHKTQVFVPVQMTHASHATTPVWNAIMLDWAKIKTKKADQMASQYASAVLVQTLALATDKEDVLTSLSPPSDAVMDAMSTEDNHDEQLPLPKDTQLWTDNDHAQSIVLWKHAMTLHPLTPTLWKDSTRADLRSVALESGW